MIGNGDDDAPTGPDAPGEGSATSGAAPGIPARTAEMPEQGPRPGNGPDETRDGTGGRVCRYCGKALPVSSGRGNKSPYCQDGTTHGPKNLTCKQAWLTVENYRSLPGHDEQALDDASVAALGEHIDRALNPVDALREALAAIRGDLDGAVIEALRDRDDAVQRARDADGRANAADQRATEAEQAAADADDAAAAAGRRAGAAEGARDAALSERDKAVTAKNRAEARLEDARDREERADRRAREAAERAASAEAQVATLTAERDSFADQVAQLRVDLDDERERAAQSAREAQQKNDDLQQRLDAEREQHTTALDQVRTEAQAKIDEARSAAETDVAAARDELSRATSDYTTQLGELRQRLGAAEQQVTSLTDRADAAEAAGQHAAEQLQHWRRELAEALADPADDGPQLAARITRLLNQDTDSGTTS
ncbi:hypothetical protein [Saccharopolyspora taberi]|uniref:Chromosome segregation ATPase n=1 Tax=Saccharopolyspora taberi TaxID=60895 RepID=A0ABN3V923_9PSEU